MNNNRILLKSMLWNTVGSISYLGCQWLIMLLVAQNGNYDMTGNFSLAISVTNIFSAIALYGGMKSYQISDINDMYDNNVYISTRIITSLGAILGCVIFIYIVDYSSSQIWIIIAYMIFKIEEAIIDVFQGIEQKLWRLDIVGKSLLIRAIATLLVFVIGLKISNELIIPIILMSLISLIIWIIYDIRLCNKLAKLHLEIELIKSYSLIKTCSPIFISSIFFNICSFMPRFFLEKNLGTDMLGIYASIATPTVIVQVLATLIFNPLIPIFTLHYEEKNIRKFKLLMIKCICMIGVLGISAIVCSILFGKIFLQILFGAEMKSYVELLNPIIITTILTAIIWLLIGILTSIRRFTFMIVGNGIGSLVSIILSQPIINIYGMNGASISLIISQIIMIVIMMFPIVNLDKLKNNMKGI